MTNTERERRYARLRARYARDLARQREKNGGRTDAEVYAQEHARAIEELYRRAGIIPPRSIKEDTEDEPDTEAAGH